MSIPGLNTATIESLSHNITNRSISIQDLASAYFDRIDRLDGSFHSIVETDRNSDAITKLEQEISQGTIRGPLHGVPILVKNNIDTGHEMNNTAGSWLLQGARRTHPATVIEALRNAGGVIIGKTNLTQWANYRMRDSPCGNNGWSAQGGRTIAAYHDNQDPLGSSSGSGVAVDLGFAAAALGTETDGSIISPAQRSNIVGIKPSVGLTSRYGVIPITERQDSVGPMAKTVKDAAIILQIIAGRDSRDPYTDAIPQPIPDYVNYCRNGALRGVRLGVPWTAIRASETLGLDEEITLFENALKVLRDAGAIIVEDADFDTTAKELITASRPIFQADFPVNLAAYLAELTVNPNNIHTLEDVREKTRKDSREGYPDRNTAIWDAILDEQQWDNTDLTKFSAALASYKEIGEKRGLPGTLNRYSVEAIVMPTSTASTWAAVVGAPAITVPMGAHPSTAPVQLDKWGQLVDVGPGVPIGLSFLGPKWSEGLLIGLAYDYEKKTRWRERVVQMRQTY